MQILAVVVGGFFIGYYLLPRILYSPSSSVGLRRVRDEPAITFSSSGHDFIVEGKTMQILSGAIHYFRVVPGYWEDRLTRLKAAGLNTVETYVNSLILVLSSQTLTPCERRV